MQILPSYCFSQNCPTRTVLRYCGSCCHEIIKFTHFQTFFTNFHQFRSSQSLQTVHTCMLLPRWWWRLAANWRCSSTFQWVIAIRRKINPLEGCLWVTSQAISSLACHSKTVPVWAVRVLDCLSKSWFFIF